MQRSRKRQALSPDQYALDHPFIQWFASYHKRGAGKSRGGELIMGELAARRFSVGLDDDNVPVFGVAEDDVEAIMSIDWKVTAFLRRVQQRDWVALSCDDARVDGARSATPVPLRLWLPTTDGLLDGWLGADPAPKTIRVVETAIKRGKPIKKEGAPLAILPLVMKGVWESAPKAA